MKEVQIRKEIAYLEFVHDQLDSEFYNLDELLKSAGFPEGLKSVKEVAQQMLEEGP